MSLLLYPAGRDNPSVYNLTYDLDQKRRIDWSGTQNQVWTSPQRTPQKTKFPYWIKTKKTNINPSNQKFYHRKFTIDDSGGKWYLEDELVMATQGDKFRNNSSMDGYTGGLILMTKYKARDLGLTESQVIQNYRSDQAVKKSADKYGYEAPHYFFNYRSDGSIESLYVPPPPPPPIIKYIEVEVPATPPPDKVEAPPEPVFEVSQPEPVIAEQQATVTEPVNPYQLKTNIDPKWMLLAIAIVGILSAILFTLRSKNA